MLDKGSQEIADAWNNFITVAQANEEGFVTILNAIIIMLDTLGTQNNKTFKETLDVLEELHKRGLWKDFLMD